MRNRLAFFCICLILFSTLAVAFHHHDDGCDHDDCVFCIASLQHSPAELTIPFHLIQPDLANFEYLTTTTVSIVKAIYSCVKSRAPPA